MRSRCTGGIEPRVERVAIALRRRGHDVTVYLWDREGAYPRYEMRQGVRIRRLPLPAPYNRPILAIPMVWWLLAAFRATWGADVVHACDLDTLPAALASKFLRGRRIVYDIFDFYGHLITAKLGGRTRGLLLRLEASLASFVDLLLLPDAGRKGSLPENFPRPVGIVMNVPSDVALEVPPRQGFVLFYGGNLGPDRGLLQAAEALRGLEGVTLRIAGTGELSELVRLTAEQQDHVTFLGEVDHRDLLEETARAHAVLAWYDPMVPANRHASPNKLFEAMMLRRPIVASGGTRMADLVSELKCGLVVPYADGSALREAVVRLRDDPSQVESLGHRGREAFEREYNWKVNEKRLLEVYRQVLL